MTTQLSKQDYLKKYLIDGDKGKKKKKKKKVTQNSIIKSKIIDDDIDLKNMEVVDSDDLEIYDLAEEAPQIAGFVDERPEEVRLMSEYRGTKKWRIVADEFGIDDVKVVPIESENADESKNNGVSDCPREKSKKETGSSSGPAKNRRTDSNHSPPGIASKRDDSDASPPRRGDREEKCDSDVSPPRKSNRERDSDASPPRKSRKRRSRDRSPPRKGKKRKSDSDASPKMLRNKSDSESSWRERKDGREKREKYDSDASPPRRSRRNVTPDGSKKLKRKKSNSISSGKKRHDSDSSSHRRSKREKSDSDPPSTRNSKRHAERHRRDSDLSGSPNGISKVKKSVSSDVEPHWKETDSKSSEARSKSSKKKHEGSHRSDLKMGNTLDGKKSGLQNAKELRREIEELKERQKEESAIASGRDEAVIVRDRKTGLRIDPKEEARKRRQLEEKKADRIAQYAVWGKGVKQVQDSQEKLKDDLYEMSKPLARYADDKDLDEMLKNKEWEGDPMLEYIRKKKKKESTSDKPQYEGSYMPNRYGIKPGYRWDGVDRSNGYEKKWFEMQNAKKAREEEAFKWSTADM